MFILMGISLYTSRLVLAALGAEDYGIYNIVGSVIVLFGFINNALSGSTRRFINFSLGQGDERYAQQTFSASLTIHVIICCIIILLGETIGLWFLNTYLNIPEARMYAANWVYQFSIMATCIGIIGTPFEASIVAYEKMSIYAYMSIVEVSAKLGICYLLSFGDFDRLKLYATLLLIVQVGLMAFYRFYCSRNFEEAHFSLTFDRQTFKNIAGFSGWSLFASSAIALNSQGVLLLLNMFFSPAVVAARAISIQVNMAANQFVNNFRTAVNPQIVKRLAAGDTQGSHSLLLTSTKYSYYLI